MYLINGEQWRAGDPGYVEALAAAHSARTRPFCTCVSQGVEMYVARIESGYCIKRMPYTGCRHAVDCPSYEPPAELSGLAPLVGTAIQEDPATGTTTLRLSFSLSRLSSRSSEPSASIPSDTATSDGSKLTLRALLHYLWEQAGLTRWHPGFAGRRSWATVRRHLLDALRGKSAKGERLVDQLYVPEVFSVEEREQIESRRRARMSRLMESRAGRRRLMLVIGELKELCPARHGFKVVLKHVPDQPFSVDVALHARMARRFEGELALWSASDALHMVMIATVGANGSGVPIVEEISLMPTMGTWIPIEDVFEQALVGRLVEEGRQFVKILRFSSPPFAVFPCAILTDAATGAVALYIEKQGEHADDPRGSSPEVLAQQWSWRTGAPMPGFPGARR